MAGNFGCKTTLSTFNQGLWKFACGKVFRRLFVSVLSPLKRTLIRKTILSFLDEKSEQL